MAYQLLTGRFPFCEHQPLVQRSSRARHVASRFAG
jgi:hypothetical protein